ncbi:precorrin-6A/cobalt-precorrin-6A reductase [Lentibacter sp. XHP0401]|uniref:precorrin-6A/cobalt-precorrin-6A reductase n=1 Tax=Lentibacter sp. XHP0401 TaxID=2984334 RepID=UPI0021E963CB|nr:precorrin-6A/cobalt-precorrin-6A reductase [Lentibacter sp. XHP0401]MCV2891745.1 precorrin-6A/cobalt-precorrin-6A reductase [Lentibacter sp. XHP0401]
MTRLLLLAGAGETREIAAGLAARGRDAVASFEGSARFAGKIPLPQRVGGFGGDAGFERYLESETIGAVLDVTHPFAEAVSARSARICKALGIPYAMVLRPEWAPEEGDTWVMLDSEAGAAEHIPQGSTVFVATGRGGLRGFANLKDCEVIARRLGGEPEDFPFEGGRFLQGDGPFSVAEEEALFRELGVDWLVVKNAGGAGARPKLQAARKLGIPVGMIRRPRPLEGVTLVGTAQEALDWADAHG